MSYAKSKYNIFVPYENGENIIFNPLSGAIGKFDSDAILRYQSNTCTEEETQLLVKKGIYIQDDYDERKKIDQDRIQGINNDHYKYIRIWTTSGCNARCYYCYEKGIPDISMNENTAKALISFIDKMMKPDDILRLEWFGGEPLLNHKIIDYIMNDIIKICDKRKYTFSAEMITNGSLINKNIVKLMKRWKIFRVQITLDGYGNDYNNIKNYYNPKEYNFAKVIEGIKELDNNGIKVAIRMNYDTSNYNTLMELIGYLNQEFNARTSIFYYIYPIWSALNGKAENQFISSTKTDGNYLNLLQLIVKNKMGSIKDMGRLYYKKHLCNSCSINSYTIFPNGDIGKCSETFVQTIGNVWDGVVDVETYNIWTSTEIDEECKSCVYLPLCQGGCRSSNFTKMPKCYINKNILPDILKWYIESFESTKT